MLVLLILLLISIITYPIPSARIMGQPYAVILSLYCVIYLFFRIKVRRVKRDTIIPYLGIMIGYIVSSVLIWDFDFEFFLNITAFYIIFFVFANLKFALSYTKREAAINGLFYVIIISGLFLALYGYYGYLTGNVGTEAALFNTRLNRYWGIHYTESTRNADVHYVVFPLIAVLVMKKKNPLHWFMLLLFSTAVLLSMSRNAWICISIVFIVYLRLSEHKNKFSFIWILLPIMFGLVAGYYLLQYFGLLEFFTQKILSIVNRSQGISNSNLQRLQIILVTIETIATHPLGVGSNNMSRYFNSAGLLLNHAENTYLNITAELGIIAAFAYSLLIILPIKKTRQNYQMEKKYESADKYVLLSSIYLLITLLFNTETLNCYIWLMISINWFMLGIGKKNGSL